MIVTPEQVTQAFVSQGFTMNERFKETGFLYFPTDGSRSAESPHQGRVFWMVEKHDYPDSPEGALEEQLDRRFGGCKDSIQISAGWGRLTDKQVPLVQNALKLYVLGSRQLRGEYHYSFADKREREQAKEEVEANV